MITRQDGPPFHVIGENIHCSRVVKREGVRIGAMPDGRPAVRVPTPTGEELLPVPDVIVETNDFRQGRVKHVMVAVRHGMDGTEHAELAATYLRWMADRQIAGGADWLDVNVDEIHHEIQPRRDAMAWVTRVVVTAPVAMPTRSASCAMVVTWLARPARQSFSGTAALTPSVPLRDFTPVVIAAADGAESVTCESCE